MNIQDEVFVKCATCSDPDVRPIDARLCSGCHTNERTIGRLRQAVVALEERLKSAEAENRNLAQQLSQANDDIHKLQERIKQLRKQVRKLNAIEMIVRSK